MASVGRDPRQPVETALDRHEDRRQPGALARVDARHEPRQEPGAAHQDGRVEGVSEEVGHGAPLEAVGPGQDQDEVDEDEGGHAAAKHEVGHDLAPTEQPHGQAERREPSKAEDDVEKIGHALAPPEVVRAEMGATAVSPPCGSEPERAKNA